jgi:hypothetical protein
LGGTSECQPGLQYGMKVKDIYVTVFAEESYGKTSSNMR